MIGRLFSSEGVARDLGLLVIRLGIGFSIAVFHGYDKMSGGQALWERLGSNMENLHITFAPVFWGFMAAFAEFVGSILLVLGPLFRTATLLLAASMFVAVMRHVRLPPGEPGAGLEAGSHALELLCVYLGLFCTGPGKYAFRLQRSRRD